MNTNRAMQLAVQNHQAGRLAEAEEIYRRMLIEQPNHPDALHLLGVIAHQTNRLDLGIELIRRAIAISPAIAHYHNNLANALRDKQRPKEAIAAYRDAVRLRPDYPEAQYNLGVALRGIGQLDEAIAAFQAALRINPEFADACNDLGSALREKGLLDEAITQLREALRLKPDLHKAYNNLGNALHEKGQLDEAMVALRQGLRIKPDIAEVHNNLGNVLRDAGLVEQAVATLREAVRLRPDFAEAHCNLGIALLLRGDFDRGWAEYEWRWRCKDVAWPRGQVVQPRWNGAALDGRTIIIHCDAGFGDSIQFVRYLPMVANRGGKIILECQAPLRPLLEKFPGVDGVVSSDQPLPHFDVHCPLTSLPLALGARMETIPAEIPYLRADDGLSRRWARRLSHFDGVKVGIAWAGNSRHSNNRNRSLSLSQFGPLARVRGVTFCSLQKGEAAPQASAPPKGMTLFDYTPELNDFGDTAALIANLDLVIAVDTAVAHLAGAMGKTVWALLPYAPDWRWLLDREDSPWYPTMRLFRQKSWGDWSEVIERAAQSLGAMCSERSKE